MSYYIYRTKLIKGETDPTLLCARCRRWSQNNSNVKGEVSN
jgi:hypothetical protein